MRRAWGGSATCRPKRQLRHSRHSRSSERQQPTAPRLSAGMGETNREDRFPSGPLSQGHLAQGRHAVRTALSPSRRSDECSAASISGLRARGMVAGEGGVPAASSSVPSGAAAASIASTLSPPRPRSTSCFRSSGGWIGHIPTLARSIGGAHADVSGRMSLVGCGADGTQTRQKRRAHSSALSFTRLSRSSDGAPPNRRHCATRNHCAGREIIRWLNARRFEINLKEVRHIDRSADGWSRLGTSSYRLPHGL